jgi:aryl-alcohol dehydrogenase-like predicted oxidoreductase
MDRPPTEVANRSLVKYRLIIHEMGGWTAFQRILAALGAIAERHRVAIPAVALRFVLDQSQVAATITGLDSLDQARETRRALEIRLDDRDREELAAALSQARIPPGPVYGLERDREGPHGRIMKYNLNRG